MRKYILIFGLVFSLSCFFASQAYSYDKAGHDCAKCHKMVNDDAMNILKDVIPDIKIIEIRQAPIKGLWEIAFDSRGQKGLVYVDFTKEKIMFIKSGGLFDIKTRANLTGERLYSLNKIDISKIPTDEALLMGDKSATKKVVVFTDPD